MSQENNTFKKDTGCQFYQGKRNQFIYEFLIVFDLITNGNIKHFKKIVTCFKKIGYNIDILWQTASMFVSTVTFDMFASLFNCTVVSPSLD